MATGKDSPPFKSNFIWHGPKNRSTNLADIISKMTSNQPNCGFVITTIFHNSVRFTRPKGLTNGRQGHIPRRFNTLLRWWLLTNFSNYCENLRFRRTRTAFISSKFRHRISAVHYKKEGWVPTKNELELTAFQWRFSLANPKYEHEIIFRQLFSYLGIGLSFHVPPF